ncbi:MAG: zinc-binding alcohol dehydrogenase family protein, partial [Rhodospirillales bacterium]
MRAIGYAKSLTSDQEKSLEDITIPEPAVGARDLLVRVAAVSVNPVDVKVRMRAEPAEGHTVLGFDAVGVVEAVGADVTLFGVGDEVFYAGDITRPGSNAELQAVDERIVGRKPSTLSAAEAAALPLTGITAWEILFDSFRLKEGDGAGEVLLIIGAAGGVGSMLMQLAKAVTGLTVVATASRPETTDWCRKLGADHIIDHSKALKPQLDALGLTVGYVAALTASGQHLPAIVDLIRPRGQIAMID